MDATAIDLVDGQIGLETYLLKQLVRYFLREYPISNSSLSNWVSAFQRLVQIIKDPPLEIMWFYGAVEFHSSKPNTLMPPAKLLVAQQLLETLYSCSSSCSVVKKVAVIAPVLYLLYHLDLNFSARDPSLREEIRIVVEGIVSYISICCSQCLNEGHQGTDSLGENIVGLIRVWTVDHIRDRKRRNVLASFFPILNNEFQQEVTTCSGYLAGVVMNEALLLRLCLKISPGIEREELQREMLKLAIQTIKGFRNFYFLDLLLNMLLEPSLPIAASLSPEDAVLLQKALYDAVILIDYTFYSGRWVQPDISHSKRLALVWVLAAHHAIEFARATADEGSVASYLDAFRESQLVAELIKWVHGQAGTVDQNAIPEITTPIALTHWLLVLQDQGIAVFDSTMSLLHDKAVACIFSLESDSSPYEQTVDLNIPDAVEDQEMHDPTNNGFPGDLYLMSTKADGGRKRKEALNGGGGPRVKQLKLEDDHPERVIINISSEDDDMET